MTSPSGRYCTAHGVLQRAVLYCTYTGTCLHRSVQGTHYAPTEWGDKGFVNTGYCCTPHDKYLYRTAIRMSDFRLSTGNGHDSIGSSAIPPSSCWHQKCFWTDGGEETGRGPCLHYELGSGHPTFKLEGDWSWVLTLLYGRFANSVQVNDDRAVMRQAHTRSEDPHPSFLRTATDRGSVSVCMYSTSVQYGTRALHSPESWCRCQAWWVIDRIQARRPLPTLRFGAEKHCKCNYLRTTPPTKKWCFLHNN